VQDEQDGRVEEWFGQRGETTRYEGAGMTAIEEPDRRKQGCQALG
jgi:hypothetical protein